MTSPFLGHYVSLFPGTGLTPGVPAGGIHVSEIDPGKGCLFKFLVNGKDGG